MKKIPVEFLRKDDALKQSIIARVVDQSTKDALKDGALHAELQSLEVPRLLELYGSEKKDVLKKSESQAFGKEVYLLGVDTDGVSYWLEAARWECGWYWGFGYVETYTQNWNPKDARDINSHEHIDSSFVGKIDGHEYVHNLHESPRFQYTTFNESEGWKLSELFRNYYQLRTAAELFGRGGSHVTTSPAKKKLEHPEYAEKINKEMIPAVTAEIIKILKPASL